MDWSTVVTLAAITWLDGMRRVPAGAVVLRRALVGQWTVGDPGDDERPWRCVAWWSPFTLALVIPAGGIGDAHASIEVTGETLDARLARTRRVVGALRLLGALTIVGIVFGIPAAIARFGGWGFVAALLLVFVLAVGMAVTVTCALRSTGRTWGQATRVARCLLWPFTAPRAAELVLERAVAGAAPLMVARRLLEASSFAAWVRPQAYDALREDTPSEWSGALVTLVGRSNLAAIVHAAPVQCEAGECYCPRCARVYRAGTETCAECHGLRLVARATPVGGARPVTV